MDFWSSFDPSSAGYKIMLAAYTDDASSFKEAIVSLCRATDVPVVIRSIRDPRFKFGVIHMAAGGGSLQLCKYICEDLKLNFDEIDGLGRSALFFAAYHGKLDIASYLLCLGADPNKADVNGLRPLHWAVQGGYSEMIRCLIKCGALADPESTRGTPLHMASLSGYHTCVKILLENGACVRSKIDGYTPLAVAILSPSTSCVKELMLAGADISDIADIPSNIWSKHTNGTSDCIRRLLEANADLNILCADDTPEEPIMMPYPLCSGACDKRARFVVGCCGRSYCTVDHFAGEPSEYPPNWCSKVDNSRRN